MFYGLALLGRRPIYYLRSLRVKGKSENYVGEPLCGLPKPWEGMEPLPYELDM